MTSGQLGKTSTPDLLRRYAADGATGCLRIEQENMQARVYFRDGAVYAATAPGARARLGDRLVGAGHITEEELVATLEYQRTLVEPRRIGELLIEQGLIDRETMRAFVREQSTDSLAVTLGWQEGDWSFTADEEVPEDVPLGMSVENLLMEGARRLEEWEVIQRRIGSTDAVVDFVPRDDTAELALTADEWSMLTRIDGMSSISEIADEAGYGEFEAARIIYGLLTAGIVTLLDDEEVDEDVEAVDETERVEDRAPAAPDLDPAPEPAPTVEHDAEPAYDDADMIEWVEPADASERDEQVAPAAAAQAPESEPGDDLFEEFGLGDDLPPAPEPQPAPEPEPPAEEEPEPQPEPQAPAPSVNRNELMREFAALDDVGGEPQDLPPAPPPPRPPPRRDDDDGDKRKGLFGRLKRN